MSAVGLRDMPVITAYPAPGFPGHWCAVIDGRDVTYPSQDAMRSAARRLAGASVRFVDPASRSAAHPEVTPRTLSAEPPSSTRDASTSQPVASGEVHPPG